MIAPRVRPDRLRLAAIIALAACHGAAAEPVMLPAGANIPLVLQEHVNSGYTPVGSSVHFRIAQDVVVDGRRLLAAGTLVTGRMEQATNRGRVGRPGMMMLEIRSVPAVDGTAVPVDADFSSQGRSRGAATAGWTLFWGLPGLITRGANPYLIKGDQLQATVLTATAIDPAMPTPTPPAVELGPAYVVREHRWQGDRVNGEKFIDIERVAKMATVSFKLQLPGTEAEAAAMLGSLRLLRVDGVPVPDETRAMSVVRGAAVFDGWSIARYCGHGASTLLFAGTGTDGLPFHATRVLTVEIKTRKKN